MGVRFPSQQTVAVLSGTVGINAETAVVTTAPLTLPLDFAQVLLFWYMIHTVGTTATTCIYRLRTGTGLTGGILNAATPVTVIAGNTVQHSGVLFQNTGAQGGLQYTLSCIDVGSTVAGAIQEAGLIAFAL